MSERPFYITAEITLYAENENAAVEQLHKLLGDAPDNVQIASVVADSDDYYDEIIPGESPDPYWMNP